MKFKLFKFIHRNRYCRNGTKLPPKKVNLEYYKDALNLGDYLSRIVCDYMLSLRSLSFDSKSQKHKIEHLMAIGSILGGRGDFDATVWGSGVKNFMSIRGLCRKRFYQKLDVRAVRGPITRDALIQCGFQCPQVYGDPAILMPMICTPKIKEKCGTILITHYLTAHDKYARLDNITLLDIKTADYESFIDAIASAERVISSSLHGIILAETYGTPAVFLRKGIESEILKFYDWYYSTGRFNVVVASTVEEALTIQPMPLPELSKMQEELIKCFPYDLWENTKR